MVCDMTMGLACSDKVLLQTCHTTGNALCMSKQDCCEAYNHSNFFRILTAQAQIPDSFADKAASRTGSNLRPGVHHQADVTASFSTAASQRTRMSCSVVLGL